MEHHVVVIPPVCETQKLNSYSSLMLAIILFLGNFCLVYYHTIWEIYYVLIEDTVHCSKDLVEQAVEF
jgi:hypothetical protein